MMRLIRLAVTSVTFLGVAAASGCGDDVSDRLACSAASECVVTDGSEAGTLNGECCSGYCMLAAMGCDTGYRYISTDQSAGVCVPTPANACAAVVHDFSGSVDMSNPGDGG